MVHLHRTMEALRLDDKEMIIVRRSRSKKWALQLVLHHRRMWFPW